ncbi:MAG TPA: hypothetical protein VGM54_26140 [Chthoniobacter sp.]|jgi:hypothetical protein
MTTKQVLETVVSMPRAEWMKIQAGIAEMIVAKFSDEEAADIQQALTEAAAEFARGEGIESDEMRRRFGV